MRVVLAVLIAVLAPAHVRFAVFGVPVSVPAGWLILAGEVLVTAAVAAWLATRVIRRFRSAPWPRPAFAGGAVSAAKPPAVAELEAATAATSAVAADPDATLAGLLAAAEAEEAAYRRVFTGPCDRPGPEPETGAELEAGI